jgi:hypothetical protein
MMQAHGRSRSRFHLRRQSSSSSGVEPGGNSQDDGRTAPSDGPRTGYQGLRGKAGWVTGCRMARATRCRPSAARHPADKRHVARRQNVSPNAGYRVEWKGDFDDFLDQLRGKWVTEDGYAFLYRSWLYHGCLRQHRPAPETPPDACPIFRLAGRYTKRMSAVHRQDLLDCWRGKEPFDLDELVACKIRADKKTNGGGCVLEPRQNACETNNLC